MSNQFRFTSEPVSIVNVNFRLEKHGDDNVPACDIRCEMRRENVALDIIDPALLDMLYVDDFPDHAKTTKALAGMERKSHLRVPTLSKPIELARELVNVAVDIPWGLKAVIHLHDAKVNKWQVEPQEGGTVTIRFRIQCEIDPKDASKLVGLWLGGDVELSMESTAEGTGAGRRRRMSARRLYRIRDKDTKAVRLVDATSQASARNHILADRLEVDVPSARDAASMIAGGARVEVAGTPREQDDLAATIASDMASMDEQGTPL